MLALGATTAQCQDISAGERARAQLIAAQPTHITQAIVRWQTLSRNANLRFEDYAGFLLAYPGFPEEAKLRTSAEKALETTYADPARVVAFFDRFAPVGNPARAQYALALVQLRRPEARQVAIEAWRGGPMADAAETAIWGQYGAQLTAADHDARLDALLWEGDARQTSRWLAYASPAARPLLTARLALVQGSDAPAPAAALSDPGYVYNLAQRYRSGGQGSDAVRLLADRPNAAKVPLDQRKWIALQLATARSASAESAVRIASKIDDAFQPGEDVSLASFRIRDDYTSLMWLGGTRALWELRDATRAAALFYRYGAAARTPQTRSKGFYWAGRAMAQGRNQAEANRYFEMAAQFGDHFYGMLALERLGRPLPDFHNMPRRQAAPEQRATFYAKPLTQAVRSVAQGADWLTTLRFFREIAEEAKTEDEHLLVAELVQVTGRRDLGVILGQAAHVDGFGNFQQISFPLIETPRNGNWTMIHAITRQESQFAQNAISHAGARGLMQLMPGTAREQAGKLGLSYNLSGLIDDPVYNVTLGDAYFRRMLNTYGSYPLAVAAYNAGPGNVNKWVRANGDPRRGEVDWIEWIEAIPFFETRNYVQRVLENAVVYEAMNPARASYRGPNPLSRFIGKSHSG
jgi:soluble lytic murein transglycosylase